MEIFKTKQFTTSEYMNNNKVLISTIASKSGGVSQMVSFVAESLIKGGYKPVIAYYQPYSISPELSVPLVTHCLIQDP